MSDPRSSGRPPTWKLLTASLVGIAALAGLGYGTWEANEVQDRDRPMYHDTFLMAGYQYDALRSGGTGLELTVDAKSVPVTVGGERFTPSPGVVIVVEKRESSYCVQGRNQYGHETDWTCVDGTGSRPELGALEGENF